MTHRFDSRTALDHYEAALEASCDALITLQLISASTASSCAEGEQLQGETPRALKPPHRTIKALRHAIEELRLAQNVARNALALGFVVGTDAANWAPTESPGTQSKPRRTA